MGITCRVFIVDENDSVQRLSMARLDRLLLFDQNETLPQHARKRVRCAMAIVGIKGREVLRIRHIDYFLLSIDAKGRIDKKEWGRGVRLAMELIPSGLTERHLESVVDARHRFMKRRYEHEFKQKPNPQVEEAIVTAIFGPT